VTFAERLRHAREALRGLTQAQLAEKAGLPPTSISHFENTQGTRKPSFDNLRRLALALEVSTDYLLGHTDNPLGITVDDKLYRDVKLLSEDDRRIAEGMIERLAGRNKGENK
jgi:transcriptional regulator with XRE-family HTH domain